jgi:hypothetical protein
VDTWFEVAVLFAKGSINAVLLKLRALLGLAFSALQSLVAETKSAQSKQRLRQFEQTTVWYLNFDINGFDWSDEVYLAQRVETNASQWSEESQ